jgi:hypothetical protein
VGASHQSVRRWDGRGAGLRLGGSVASPLYPLCGHVVLVAVALAVASYG